MTALIGWTQMANASIFAAICLAGLYVARRWPVARPMMVPPFLWAAYGVVFYLILFGGYLSPDEVLLWGAIHRFLGALMVLGGVLTIWAVLNDEAPDFEYDEYPDDGCS